MNEMVHVDKASVEALTEAMRAMSKRIAELEEKFATCRRERDEARALLIQHGLATADEATEPGDGGAA
jgi:hypothetical protein